jgi:dihydrolipoamide dehydrogenase
MMQEQTYDIVVIGSGPSGREHSLHSTKNGFSIVGPVPIDRLWHAVPSFPTVSEIWIQLLENYDRSIS